MSKPHVIMSICIFSLSSCELPKKPKVYIRRKWKILVGQKFPSPNQQVYKDLSSAQIEMFQIPKTP